MKPLFCLPLGLMCLVVAGVLVALLVQATPGQLLAALVSRETGFALRLSLMTSAAAVAMALLLGIPAAYVLARASFGGKIWVDTLLDIPMVMTPLVVGMGLLFLLGPDLLGQGPTAWVSGLLFSPGGAIAAQAFIATPILVRSCKAAFEEVDPRYEWAAQTIGLKPLQVFWRISLPMARGGILSGIVLAWARCLGEFGATLMVAGATRFKTETLPIAVYMNLTSGETGLAVASAWVLIVLGCGVLVVLKVLGRRRFPSTAMPIGGR